MIQYLGIQNQSVRGPLKVLAKLLKTIFDKVHFIINFLYQNAIKKYEDDLNIRFVIFSNVTALATFL